MPPWMAGATLGHRPAHAACVVGVGCGGDGFESAATGGTGAHDASTDGNNAGHGGGGAAGKAGSAGGTCGELQLCGDTCIDTKTDPLHCGACGQACSTVNMNSSTCSSGKCVGQCEYLFADCDDDVRSNGCESEPSRDPANCGACGNACPEGIDCKEGKCVRLVFTTSSVHSGALGGLAAADEICQKKASGAGPTGTFMAWLSTPGNAAKDRLPIAFSATPVAVVTLQGNIVAPSVLQLPAVQRAQSPVLHPG